MLTTRKSQFERKRYNRITIARRISLILILAWLPASSLAAVQSPGESEPPFFYSWLAQDSVPGPTHPPELSIKRSLTSDAPDASALPSDCGELAAPGEDPPESCVYGYVYQDGIPVSGATVTVSSELGSLNAVTQIGPSSTAPYFAARLSPPPIAAQPSDMARASTAVAGETNSTTFAVRSGAQQADVWFSTACGPSYVGGVIASDTTWRRECSPYIVTENVLLYAGYLLEIQPGVTVRFQPGKSLRIDGELRASGLPEAMVRMTSDGASVPGTWGYVLFAPSCVNALYDGNGFYLSGSIMQDALIEYAGGATDADNAALRLDNCSPFFPRTHIRHSGGDGVRIYDGGMLVMTGGSVRESAGWAVYNRSNAAQMLVAYSTLADNGLGGVYSTNGTKMRVSDNWILRNTGNFGVYIAQGSGMISNNWISGNEGGVRLGAASDLHHNVIYANQGGAGVRTNSYTMNINHNIILENENPTTYGGGLYSSSGASNINYNVFAGNQAKMGGGAYIASGSTFRNNTVLSNRSSDQGGGLYVTNSNATVDFNTLLGNQSGAGLGGVYIKNYPVFTGNNLYGNTSYDLVNGNLAGAGDLKAEFNWWGTIELPEILSHIWDYLDDSTLSLVDFDPAWAYPQLGAPISLPTGLQVLRSGNSLELSWNENPESDTAGYKIYYDTDGPGFPYSGTGLLQGDAPIDVGEALNYTLTSVPDGVYHFGLTAYDSDRDGQDDQTEGNESWFSDDVMVTVGQIPEAGFSAAPTTGPRPLSVNFTNQSSGNIASCSWDFGDGSGSDTCGNPSHSYSQIGSFTVTLTVSGPAGSDSEVKPGYITVSPIPSHADFSAAPTSGVRPLEVHFTNLSGGDYTACNWNFGDGATSSNCSNPTHTYIQAGVYTVSLNITGPGGMDGHALVDLITVQEAYRNCLPLILR